MEMELREGGNTSARLVAKNSSNRMLYFYGIFTPGNKL